MKLTSAATACAAALLGGCSLIPDYFRPGLPVAESYPTGAAYKGKKQTAEQAAISADAIGWRDFFTDPRLQQLIDIAIRNNRDLRVAVLNVAQAQAQFRVQRSDLFPHISLSNLAEYGQLPESSTIPSTSSGEGAPTGGSTVTAPTSTSQSTSAKHSSYRYYSSGIGFTSYELDVFGRLRSLSEQAFEQYLGYEATARSSQISLIAEVATGYLAVLADQALLGITQDTVASEQKNYDLTDAMVKGGTSTMLSLRQAETALDTAKANLALYTRQAAQDENALVLLLGQPLPSDLPLGRGLEQQTLMADLPEGLPSDVLLRRPDVIAAEHNLIAANANIGAARAAFFPSVTLTGSGGVGGSQLSRLFTAGGLTWNLDLAKIQKNIQVATYEKTIQTAFREVSDALAARSTYIDQVASQQQLVDAAADSLRLSTLRFRSGVDDYLPVLTAQQSLYSAQQQLLSLKQAQLANLVTLYKALGGGWNERTVPPAATADATPSKPS